MDLVLYFRVPYFEFPLYIYLHGFLLPFGIVKRGPGLLDDALNIVDSIVITKVFNFLPLTAFQVFHQVRVDIVENFNDDRQNEIRNELLKSEISSFETSKPKFFGVDLNLCTQKAVVSVETFFADIRINFLKKKSG